MKKSRALSISASAVIVAIVVLVLAAGGSANKAPASGATVGVKQTALGSILVGTSGRTLYLFLADKPNVSTLSRAGFAVWPAFVTTGATRAGGGANASKIATIASRGRKHQLTYAGHPLYYFVGDQRSGSTSGQGLFEFGAKWYAISPNGKAVTSAPAAPAPATSEPTGGGYRY
ncbi:MAG: lipoprotein [Solirubrobacterales bacterium]|nr:lipoprotein [Solirubrobacterales bacterium]